VRESPPAELIELVSRLGLAAPGQVVAVESRVRRLASGLPGFQSVWVDALAQARTLTPYQAVEINAGRGARLQVGNMVLVEPLDRLGYATLYRAREIESRRELRLAIIDPPREMADSIRVQLPALVRRTEMLRTAEIIAPCASGEAGEQLWLASPFTHAQTASRWLVHRGRFRPEAAAEIARQLCQGLAACEAAGLVHGDLSTRQLLIDTTGHVALAGLGLRGILRPAEGFAHADLSPEAYDYLAPERITVGGPPTIASDLYAFGALCWHLLAGRPPIPGATGLAKMKGAQLAKIPDIALLAPDSPTELILAIKDCLQRDPTKRPKSFAQLCERLGPPTSVGKRHLTRSAHEAGHARLTLGSTSRSGWTQRMKRGLSVAGSVGLVLAVATWPQWGSSVVPARSRPTSPTAMQKTKLAAPLVAGTKGPGANSRVEPIPAVLPRDGNAVVQATAIMPVRQPGPIAGSFLEGQDLVLSADAPLALSELPLKPGQRVRASEGQRAVIEVPAKGLAIEVEDVTFSNIDFVWHGGPAASSPTGESPATTQPAALLVNVRNIKFEACSWQAAAPTADARVAIHWRQPASDQDAETLLGGGLRLHECLFRGVAAGVHCESAPAALVELSNTLHLGPGPLVSLAQAPLGEERFMLSATHVTLREAEGLLSVQADEGQAEAGKITIEAASCAFMPSAGSGLLVFSGSREPRPWLNQLQWTGQGSVLAQQAPLALYYAGQGSVQVAGEEDIRVEGLVRSDVGFAGDKDSSPAASRVVRWQVPLQSPDPPGITENGPTLRMLR
jgi:hypothetical protein